MAAPNRGQRVEEVLEPPSPLARRLWADRRVERLPGIGFDIDQLSVHARLCPAPGDRVDHEIERGVVQHAAVDEIDVRGLVPIVLAQQHGLRVECNVLADLVFERRLAHGRESAGKARGRTAREREIGGEFLSEPLQVAANPVEDQHLTVITVTIARTADAGRDEHLEPVEICCRNI